MSKLKLEFPPDTALETDGLGDAGIETFRDSAYASCAREAGQNSRDAALGNDLPVRVTFNVLHVPREDIPDLSRLTSALESCLELAHEEKDNDFFKSAIHALKKETIPVLHIADYNTTGLVGPPNTRGTAFHSLLKSRGVTNKGSNDNSAGSFGIGKNAVVAVSDLQTVFYSTIYKDAEGAKKFAAQGKAILVSHKGPDGIDRRSTGYWGNVEDFSAVTELESAPSWMRRTEVGTSIFCIGFREGDGSWEDLMISSIVSNFFGAVVSKQMEFEVGAQKINANTLESLLSSPKLRTSAMGTDLEDELEFASSLHRCLISGAAVAKELEIKDLGKIKVRILTEKGLPRRLGFVRNGMLITDNLSYFGHKFQKFPAAKDFICLVEPADSAAGKLLKTLENPKHKDFSADRIADEKKRNSAIKAMRALGNQLRDMINSTAGAKVDGSVAIDELAQLFVSEGDSHDKDSKGGLDPERFIYRVVEKDKILKSNGNEAGSSGGRTSAQKMGGGGGGGGGGGNNGIPGRKVAGQAGSRGARNKQEAELLNLRNRISHSGGSNKKSRTIYFSPATAGTIEIDVMALGVNSPDALKIVSSDLGSVKSGGLILDVEKDKRYAITVSFDEPYDGPIEVLASSINNGGEST